MPAISRIRFTNVVYEGGGKRYNDEIFLFDGHNSAMLLENGGGKTVFIQTAMQAIIPHINMAERKIKDTLSLENAPAHIAIEWIINDKPRRYALTATSLYIENNQLNSLKYTYDYSAEDGHGIEEIPFSIPTSNGGKRPATRGEISDYYSRMNKQSIHANVFSTITDYGKFIENTYKIIPSEWRKVAVINSGEGNVDEFFNKCKTTEQLLSNLLIPVIEEAIEGDNSEKFVETFERQREHFKKNRILQDKIEQSQLIKEKMDEYVAVYKAYEDQRLNLQKVKRETKAVSDYVKQQLVDGEEELKFNEASHFALKQDQRAYDQKVSSFDLYCLEEQCQDVEVSFKQIGDQYAAIQEKVSELKQRKQNIEWTMNQKDISLQKEQLEYLKSEIEKADQEVEVQDIKTQLDENSSLIRGQFAYEIELIDREMAKLQETLDQSVSNLSQYQEQLLASLDYEKDVISERSLLEANLENQKMMIDRYSQQLFGDDPAVPLNLYRDTLESKQGQLVRDRHVYESRISELKQIIHTKSKALDNLQVQQVDNKEAVTKLKEQRRSIDEKMSQLILEIEQSGYPLYMNGHIYGKEASIIRELEEQRETYLHKKQKALKEERLKSRLHDQYADIDVFVTEPGILDILEDLKEQFDFVRLGTDYIQTVVDSTDDTIETLFEKFPYWPMTIVTSISDKDKLVNVMNERSSHLMTMIYVLSREEVNQLLKQSKDQVHNFDTIIPSQWGNQLDADVYRDWKLAIEEEAKEASHGRQEAEVLYHQSDRLLTKCKFFFKEHTYEAYESLKEEILELEQNHKQMVNDVSALDLGIKEDQDSLVKTSQLLSDLSASTSRNADDFRLLELIEELQKSKVDQEKSLKLVHKKYDELLSNISTSQNHCKNLEASIHESRISLTRFQSEKDRVLKMDLFIEVEAYQPYGSTSSLDVLKEQRTNLKNQLLGLNRSRQEVESRIKEHEGLLRRYEQEAKKLQHESDFELSFVEVYYDNETDDLFDQMNVLIKESRVIESKLKAEDHQLTQLKTRCSVLRESLNRDFDGVINFDVESYHIEERLKVEKATLLDRSRKLNFERKEAERKLKVYDLLYRDLEIKDGAYHYMSIDLEPLLLSKSDIKKFEEHPEAHVRTLLSQLEGQYKLTQKAYTKTTNKQESVMQYCRNQVSDKRLLETLSTGLNAKSDYQSLLVYQEKMTEIIMKIIKVAEDDKRESDLELQTFLSHLMTYVKSVSNELDSIQNKTRITINDEVKQIFVFDIPEWEEDDAKALLRHYIDETIHYYEKESLHEDVTEETLRKALTERLSVMSLLNVVLNEQPIKIKCRKVTNDMKINKAPMVWESSNKWSGGEKWSKNMTLFLSILNYLAEKKQHLSANQKRQRSVILDNPFGKASSDHVLKPVFMIAEKLGFQIIALTAHAEGKFISEYFPVVYSCRLRKTKDSTKQIMTNEKILNHTYLREHAPMTIMRMQEVEQMTLFDA